MAYVIRKIKSIAYLLCNIRWYALYRIDLFRYLICRIRKVYYVNIKKKLKCWDGDKEKILVLNSGINAIEHNIKGLHDMSCARSLRIIKPLSVIETYRPLELMPKKGGVLYDLDFPCDAKVLTIGPRTEGEIFCLRAYGFKPENIRGLDLISYSPYIDVGDMHGMPYDDEAFDIVIASCVLVYSIDPEKACSEIARVVKKGGLVCIAQDTNLIESNKRVETTGKNALLVQDYLNLFKHKIRQVFFQHEIPERLRLIDENEGARFTCSVIFQITK